MQPAEGRVCGRICWREGWVWGESEWTREGWCISVRRAVGPLVTRALEMSRTDRGGAECGNVRRVSRHVYRALYDVGEELREQCGRRDASDEHVRLVGGRWGQQFEQRSHREAHALEDRATHCQMDISCTDGVAGHS